MTPDQNTLLSQQDQDEQAIINNIRADLEHHKDMSINTSSIDETLQYTEMTAQAEEAVIEQTSHKAEMESKLTTLVPMKKQKLRALRSQDEKQMTAPDATQFDQHHPFMCSSCPKRFAKRIDLRRHESVHNQQRGFECPVCEKWFPNKTSYGRHERTHTGERPFPCEYCGKSFSQGAILARHVMTHTGVKPFKCDVCNKGFTQREGLRVHMRQHTKEQQEIQLHECPLCEKAFCHPSGLSRHLIIHTGKTFDCTICSKVFTDSSSLRRHTKRHADSEDALFSDPAK